MGVTTGDAAKKAKEEADAQLKKAIDDATASATKDAEANKKDIEELKKSLADQGKSTGDDAKKLKEEQDKALKAAVEEATKKASAEAETNKKDIEEAVGFSELLGPGLRQPLTIGCGMMVLQQFTGINAVIFFSTEIFDGAGVDGTTGSLIVMGVQVVVTGIACLLVDKLGRKTLLYVASSGMVVSSLLMSLFYFLKNHKDNQVNALAILAMVLYIIFFSLGMGAIPWLIMSEIFPARARGLAASIATCVNWTCSFILTECFTQMKGTLSPSGTFLFFAIECCLTFCFILFYVPETKGKSLEDIEAMFKASAS
eukprot:g5023.t1